MKITKEQHDIINLCLELLERLLGDEDVDKVFREVKERHGEETARNVQWIINEYLKNSNDRAIRRFAEEITK